MIRVRTSSVFKQTLTRMNSVFVLFCFQAGCLTKVKEPSLSYYLPSDAGGILGFILFPRVLALCEMQTTSSIV